MFWLEISLTIALADCCYCCCDFGFLKGGTHTHTTNGHTHGTHSRIEIVNVKWQTHIFSIVVSMVLTGTKSPKDKDKAKITFRQLFSCCCCDFSVFICSLSAFFSLVCCCLVYFLVRYAYFALLSLSNTHSLTLSNQFSLLPCMAEAC